MAPKSVKWIISFFLLALGVHTLKDTDGGGIVVDTASGLERGDDNGGGRDKVVCERVVQVALEERVIRSAGRSGS